MRVVLCHGVFDLLHAGHLEHLQQARKMGDYLLVSLVPDAYAEKRKPVFPEAERIVLLRALRCVNGVELCDGPGPQKIIEKWRPWLYVRGSDYEGKEMPESELLRKLGIPVRYTSSISPRTSDILKEILCRSNSAPVA